MMMTPKMSIVCSVILSMTLTPLVYSEDADDDEVGWEFDLLVGAISEPTYVGSDKYTSDAGGQFQATYQTGKGIDYLLGLGEFGVNFRLGESWELTTLLEYEEGRDNSEDATLTHFPDVEDTWEGQFILAKHIDNWTIAGVFQPDLLNRGKGLVYFLGLEYEDKITEKLSMSSKLDISFADAEHINTEVGISNTVADLSGLAPYKASSGYKSTTLGFQLSYAFNDRWSIVSNVEGEFYGKNIADSPLVKDEGSDINYSLGLGVMYSF